MHECPERAVVCPELFDKPGMASFDVAGASSVVGAVLLKAAGCIYGLVKGFGRFSLVEKRVPERTRHTVAEWIAQRVFRITCGHPDANDGERLADLPMHERWWHGSR
ncbi:MAG: hypothetical protein F4X11_14695 [Acidobacteria bacterium]|nr:hypothetical protein [Acidobacteriota bacterium]